LRFEVKICENKIVEHDVMMTREDILHELELLPVWHLRVGLPSLETPPLASVTLKVAEDLSVDVGLTEITQTLVQADDRKTEIIELEVVELVVEAIAIEDVLSEKMEILESLIFTHIASEDGNWLFVLPNAALQADEAQLMQNICKAMRINAKPSVLAVNTLDFIQLTQPKMLVAMGECTAQAMLQSAEPLVDLSGKLHQFQSIGLVTTYDLAHLLKNLPDKAKTWKDLRFAMQTLQDIQL